jgi:hypothetical protein
MAFNHSILKESTGFPFEILTVCEATVSIPNINKMKDPRNTVPKPKSTLLGNF